MFPAGLELRPFLPESAELCHLAISVFPWFVYACSVVQESCPVRWAGSNPAGRFCLVFHSRCRESYHCVAYQYSWALAGEPTNEHSSTSKRSSDSVYTLFSRSASPIANLVSVRKDASDMCNLHILKITLR